MNEVLVTAEEYARADEFNDYYRVAARHGQNYDEYFSRGVQQSPFAREGYTSENAPRLTVPLIEQLLLNLPEIQQVLATRSPKRKVLCPAA
jgi:UDP-glucose 4-epimerase